MGWTVKMRTYRHPNLFRANGNIIPGSHNNFSIQTTSREPSENTATRFRTIQTIYDEVKAGKDVDEVCLKLAQDENVRKVYRLHIPNRDELTPEEETKRIIALIKNAYLSRKKNEDKVDRINGLR